MIETLSYLRGLFRSVPFLFVTSVLGLTAGVSVFLMTSRVAMEEVVADDAIGEVEALYRIDRIVTAQGEEPLESALTPALLLPQLQVDIPSLSGARLLLDNAVLAGDGRRWQVKALLADPAVFSLLGLRPAPGTPLPPLGAPLGGLYAYGAWTERLSAAVGPGDPAELRLDGKRNLLPLIGGLEAYSGPTHLTFDVVAPLTRTLLDRPHAFENWTSNAVYTYVRLEDGRARAEMQAALDAAGAFLSSEAIAPPGVTTAFVLRSVDRIRFTDVRVLDTPSPGTDPAMILFIAAAGFLAMIVAAMNVGQALAANALGRVKEMAVRRAVGASAGDVLVMVVVETVFLVAGAVFLAFALFWIVAAGLTAERAAGILPYGVKAWQAGLFALATAAVLTGATALFPASMLAAVKPDRCLHGARGAEAADGSKALRNAVVAMQCIAVVMVLGVGTTVIRQTSHLRSLETGFDPTNVIVIRDVPAEAVSNIAARLRKRLGGVQSIGVSSVAPGVESTTYVDLEPVGRPGAQMTMAMVTTSEEFFGTFGINALHGRLLSPERAADAGAEPGRDQEISRRNIVLNRTAALLAGDGRPGAAIDREFRLKDGSGSVATVVGVVPDIRFRSPKERVAPSFYTIDAREGGTMAIHLSSAGSGTLRVLEREWAALAPDDLFRGALAADVMAAYLDPEIRQARAFILAGIMVTVISAAGVVGLSLYSAKQRAGEIGIRRAYGASAPELARVLASEFFVPLAGALLIGIPAALAISAVWLGKSEEAVSVGVQPAIVAFSALLTIIAACLGYQAWRLAVMPVAAILLGARK